MHREKELQTSISFLVSDQASSINSRKCIWRVQKWDIYCGISLLCLCLCNAFQTSCIQIPKERTECTLYLLRLIMLHAETLWEHVTWYILETIHVNNQEYKWATADAAQSKSDTIQIQQIQLWLNPLSQYLFYPSTRKTFRLEQEAAWEAETVKQWMLSEHRLTCNTVKRW